MPLEKIYTTGAFFNLASVQVTHLKWVNNEQGLTSRVLFRCPIDRWHKQKRYKTFYKAKMNQK